MVALDPHCNGKHNYLTVKKFLFLFNCIGLVVLRKHFTKLCHCLPQDYNKTLCRIEENTTLPEGLVPQLEKLPTAELANCHILAAMIVPIQDEVRLVAFCDFVKDLVEGAESKEFVEKLRDGKITSSIIFTPLNVVRETLL